MIPKDVENHIFYLKNGYTKSLDNIIKEEKLKFISKRKYINKMESRLDELTKEILQVSNDSPVIVIDTENGPEKELVKKLILGYIEFLDENKYTIEEFKNYIEKSDSLGDVIYFLSEENIDKANQEEE